ncbi:hypothetical protein L6164_013978 [Bauhinia variegata]|uniref:Uncharacterized protein n=1 Tax=Bauhinia variegata TaxID=167791 RepID=A0ACB9NFR8_BAUVA|nr:hypothetical protein L6164_013978 [Bauhinia variegata]
MINYVNFQQLFHSRWFPWGNMAFLSVTLFKQGIVLYVSIFGRIDTYMSDSVKKENLKNSSCLYILTFHFNMLIQNPAGISPYYLPLGFILKKEMPYSEIGSCDILT